MLKGLRTQKRIIVATLGSGAAGQAATYPDLYGSIIIWAGQSLTSFDCSTQGMRWLAPAQAAAYAVWHKSCFHCVFSSI